MRKMVAVLAIAAVALLIPEISAQSATPSAYWAPSSAPSDAIPTPSISTAAPSSADSVATSSPPSETVADISAAPSSTPSATPLAIATSQPSAGPSSQQPTAAPTPSPADASDPSPTSSPVDASDSSPTRSPTQATSIEPSKAATVSPSASPSAFGAEAPPLSRSDPTRVSDLSLVLEAASTLSQQGVETFQNQTSRYIEDFYNNETRRRRLDVDSIQQVEVIITVTSQAPSSARFLRRLQSNDLVVTYNQLTTYSTTGEFSEIGDIVALPFADINRRNNYITYLQNTTSTAFDSVEIVRGPFFKDEDTTTPTTEKEDDSNDSLWIIIAAACGGVGLVLLILGLWWCCSKRSHRDETHLKGGEATKSTFYGEEDEKPPSQLQLSAFSGPDEVSTLAEPMPRLGVMTSNESLAGYGDQSTIGSVDYDYSRAYGGGGDTSVSSAGGTLGSGPRGGGQSRASGGDTIATPALTSGQSIFSDDASFEQHYRDQGQSLKEELIHVIAPPGKLGVVIDTPDDGAPVVHAVKDSSPIADKIKVGDKLVAVDDENVEAMTAIRVSKLISRKSANPQRKLSVIRTIVVE